MRPNQSIIANADVSETENNAHNDILQAYNLYGADQEDLALKYMNKYALPPIGVDPVFFYTLKANIFFFTAQYDSSFHYHLLAYNIDKTSPNLELPKLKGLVTTYARLKSDGHTLKDLKSISFDKSRNMTIYDLGFKKIEAPNNPINWIALHKTEDAHIFKLMEELKLVHPSYKFNN